MKKSLPVFAFVCALFATMAFGAGGGELSSTNLNGSVNLPDFQIYWGSQNYFPGKEGAPTGSSWLSLQTPYQINSVNWSFYTNSRDTSYWYAYFSVSGDKSNATILDSTSSHSHIGMGGIDLTQSSSISHYSPKGDGGTEWSSVYGGITISPAHVDSADFYLAEHDVPGLPGEPSRTIWNGSYSVSGQFIAPTLAEAQAMGAQFVRAPSVPEPSTLVLAVIGLIGIAIAAYRRRKHS